MSNKFESQNQLNNRHQDLETVFADTIWPLLPGDSRAIPQLKGDYIPNSFLKLFLHQMECLAKAKHSVMSLMQLNHESWHRIDKYITKLHVDLIDHDIFAFNDFHAKLSQLNEKDSKSIKTTFKNSKLSKNKNLHKYLKNKKKKMNTKTKKYKTQAISKAKQHLPDNHKIRHEKQLISNLSYMPSDDIRDSSIRSRLTSVASRDKIFFDDDSLSFKTCRSLSNSEYTRSNYDDRELMKFRLITNFPESFTTTNKLFSMFFNHDSNKRIIIVTGDKSFIYDTDVIRYRGLDEMLVNMYTIRELNLMTLVTRDTDNLLNLMFVHADNYLGSKSVRYQYPLSTHKLIFDASRKSCFALDGESLKQFNLKWYADMLNKDKIKTTLNPKLIYLFNKASDMCSKDDAIYIVDVSFTYMVKVDVKLKTVQSKSTKIFKNSPRIKLKCKCREGIIKRSRLVAAGNHIVAWNSMHIHLIADDLSIQHYLDFDNAVDIVPVISNNRSYIVAMNNNNKFTMIRLTSGYIEMIVLPSYFSYTDVDEDRCHGMIQVSDSQLVAYSKSCRCLLIDIDISLI